MINPNAEGFLKYRANGFKYDEPMQSYYRNPPIKNGVTRTTKSTPTQASRATVYELYDGPKGFSCQSVNYDKFSKRITHVAAVSVKQAIYLASTGVWFKGSDVGQGLGILAQKSSNNDLNDGCCWYRWDGIWDFKSGYEHGKKVNVDH